MNSTGLFRNRNFVFLWLGQSISTLGNRFYQIALMWYVINQTGSSLALGISVICFTLPEIIMAPFAGVLADKNFKKKILVIMDLLSGIVMIIIAWLVTMDQWPLYWLYSCIIIVSSLSSFLNPALSAVIPLIVGKNDLSKANSLTQFTRQLSNILGPSLAGILIAITHMWILFVLNGISFFISALMESRISIPRVEDEGTAHDNFKSRFKEGLQYVLSTRKLLYLILVGGVIINFFLAPLNVFYTIICRQILHVGAAGLGMVDSSIAIGALAGSLLIFTNFFKNKIKLAIFGLVIEGFALLIAGIFLNYTALIVFALILGLGISLASIGISTLYQTIIPHNKMGRVMAILSTASSSTVPLGTLFGSLIIVQVPITWILIIYGAIVALSGFSLIFPFTDEIRKRQPREEKQVSL